MDIAGMALGAGLELASASMNQRYQTSLMHQQEDFNQQMYANRYQMTVQDLKKAGLNPMLAYQQGAGAQPQVSQGQGARADFQSSVNATRLASAQEAKTLQDTKIGAAQEQNILWDTVNKQLEPALTAMQTMDTQARKDYTEKLNKEIDYKIQNLIEQRDEIISQVHRNNADANLKQQQIMTERSIAQLNAAKQVLTGAESRGQQIVNIIGEPKARAAMTATGSTAAHAENIKKVIETVTDPVSDVLRSFRPFSRQAVYPKKAGD